MQHSQPHMTMYLASIFLIWGDRIERIVESLMMILLYESIASLRPPYSGDLQCYYEFPGQTPAEIILELPVVLSDRK